MKNRKTTRIVEILALSTVYLLILVVFLMLSTSSSLAATQSDTNPPAKVEGGIVCENMVYVFDGTNVSFIRLFNEDHRIIQINTVMRNGDITYKFKQSGTYYMNFKFKNGESRTEKIIVKEEAEIDLVRTR